MASRAESSYNAALRQAKGNISGCDDAALMASFLDGNARVLLGAVSARLIWEGAQARGMTNLELAALMQNDPDAARELMWG